MLAYILRRLLYTIPILIGVNIIVFMLFFLVNTPDQIARKANGEKAKPEAVERWKIARDYHLPLFLNTEKIFQTRLSETDTQIRYDGVVVPKKEITWSIRTDSESSIAKVFTETIFFKKSLPMFWGDFGLSDMNQERITAQIVDKIVPSLCITIPIFLSSIVFNIFFAMIIATFRGTYVDTVAQVTSVVLMSISPLIFIIAGQYLFASTLQLVPVSGFEVGSDMLKFLILPILIGFITSIGGGVRLYRTFFLEEINKDYVRTARAKGLSEGKVLFVHVLKNAMIPILTNVPLQLLFLIMGNLLLENFFSIPGLGNYTITAINAQDFAIVRSMVFFNSTLYIVGLLLADICYSLVDPRVRLG